MRDITVQIEQARALLASPTAPVERPWRALAAAAFAASAAILMAGVAVLGPGFEVGDPMVLAAPR